MNKATSEVRSAVDDLFDILTSGQRRRLLVRLLEHNPQDDTPVPAAEAAGEDDPERALIAFRHTHLPKLEKYGFIDWDREANAVTKGPRFEEIRPMLELLRDHADELPEGWP